MTTHNILHLIGGGEIGGAEQHVLTLLSNLNPNLFTPSVVCLTEGPFAKLLQQRGIKCYTLQMKFPLDLKPIPELIKIIRSNNISLVHTHGSRGNLLGRLAARITKIPCLSTIHSSLKFDYLSRIQARIALLLDKLTLPLANGIISVSNYLAIEASNRGAKNIRTIYNGIDPLTIPDFENSRLKFRNSWGIPLDSIVIGSIARLHPTKGLEYLINAAEIIKKRIPDIHLLIVGDGPLRNEIENLLNKTEVSYTLTGFLPKAFETLPSMDIFVLPSLSEGMGLVLLEAMQVSIPVVSTNVGGIPEVIRSEIDGLLVPPARAELLADACLKIISNKELAKSLTKSASNRWMEFSIDNMVRQTQDFYLNTLAKYPRL